jgi:hypothetical protein
MWCLPGSTGNFTNVHQYNDGFGGSSTLFDATTHFNVSETCLKQQKGRFFYAQVQ